MNNPIPPESPGEADGTGDAAAPLPELMEGQLDAERLERYWADLAACAEVHEVVVRRAAREYVPDGGRTSLAEARELLGRAGVSGVQIRYLYDGSDWLDTLLVRADGIRIVRMPCAR